MERRAIGGNVVARRIAEIPWNWCNCVPCGKSVAAGGTRFPAESGESSMFRGATYFFIFLFYFFLTNTRALNLSIDEGEGGGFWWC